MKSIFLVLSVVAVIGLISLYGFYNYSYSPTEPVSEYFSDPNVQALALATAKGDIAAMDAAVAAGADVNAIGKTNMTPLFWSFVMYRPPHRKTASYKRGFKHLVSLGADPLIEESKRDWSTWTVATGSPEPYFMEVLIDSGVDVSSVGSTYNRPTGLHSAMWGQSLDNFKRLIELGADIEAKDSGGEAIIVKTMVNGRWQFCYELLKAGANYDYLRKWNPDNDPRLDIVISLEELQYWPEAAIRYDGVDDREKVIEFLRAEGVEVDPWYPENSNPEHSK